MSILIVILIAIVSMFLLYEWAMPHTIYLDFSSYALSEQGFETLNTDSNFAQSLIVIGITANWNKHRSDNQKKNCKYFKSHNV